MSDGLWGAHVGVLLHLSREVPLELPRQREVLFQLLGLARTRGGQGQTIGETSTFAPWTGTSTDGGSLFSEFRGGQQQM